MPFTARNARYLRISAHTVLSLYIYLDDTHVDWMTDYTLQLVLEDLRPLIGPKLKAESNLHISGAPSGKKGTVYVHRGDTYQFAYFFRKNEPHAVLIKGRNFVHSPSSAQSSTLPPMKPPQLHRPESPMRSGVKPTSSSTKSAPRMRPKSKKRPRLSDSDEGDALEDNGGPDTSESAQEGTTRRSLRKRVVMAGGYRETDGDGDDIMMVNSDRNPSEIVQDMTEGDTRNKSLTTAQILQDDTIIQDPEPTLSPRFNIVTEDEEEKPKLSMRVTYQGFTIYDQCLCLIIEPWPTLRAKSRMRSALPFLARDSVDPTDMRERTPISSIREQTPLFLPELSPRRSLTPAPLRSRFYPSIPLFDDNENAEPEDQDNNTDEGGMIAFSQALKSAGDERAGSANEDENEGDVFLGDADERIGYL